MTRRQHVIYWKYSKVSLEDKDQMVSDKHGYPLALVQYVAGDFERYQAIVEPLRGDDEGIYFDVSAPRDNWEKAWLDLAAETGEWLGSKHGIENLELDENFEDLLVRVKQGNATIKQAGQVFFTPCEKLKATK